MKIKFSKKVLALISGFIVVAAIAVFVPVLAAPTLNLNVTITPSVNAAVPGDTVTYTVSVTSTKGTENNLIITYGPYVIGNIAQLKQGAVYTTTFDVPYPDAGGYTAEVAVAGKNGASVKSNTITMMVETPTQPDTTQPDTTAQTDTTTPPDTTAQPDTIQPPAPSFYTLTYDANGGMEAPDAQSVPDRTYATVSSTIPVRYGYLFLGWSDDLTAASAQYQPGDKIFVTGDVTLYAFWLTVVNPNATILYDANGGSGAPAEQTAEVNSNAVISYIIPERGGYRFDGWSVDSTAKTGQYQPGGEIYVTNDITLYAVWVLQVTITYNPNGGANAPAQQTADADTYAILSSAIPARENYTFKGWTDSGASAKYQPGGQILAAEDDITLYAVWESNTPVNTDPTTPQPSVLPPLDPPIVSLN